MRNPTKRTSIDADVDCCEAKTTTKTRLCPSCGVKGRAVKPKTIESLVSAAALESLAATDGFAFCTTQSCDVAYFSSTDRSTIACKDVAVRIGVKQVGPPMPICYCFDHSFEDIQDEVASTGSCGIPDSIKVKCAQGLQRCAETNPAGGCCLGVVNKAVDDALANLESQRGITVEANPKVSEATTLAESGKTASSADRLASLASFGALLSAALSSACCWLPLLLIGFGASAGGAASFLDAYRTPLLVATSIMLCFSFYLVYLREEKCETGACEKPRSTLTRVNKVTTAVAAVAVIGFAFFPNYIGLLFGGDPAVENSAAVPSSQLRVFAIEGMTCEGCASTLRSAVGTVNGVNSVSVSFPDRSATVSSATAWTPELVERFKRSIVGAGYSARLLDQKTNLPADAAQGGTP